MRTWHLAIITLLLFLTLIPFSKPIQAQNGHFIVSSTTQCSTQNVGYYIQVYNSTMSHINEYYTSYLFHEQNQSVGEVNKQLFDLAKNGTYDKVNLASYCIGVENVNRSSLVQPLPDTVKILTYNISEMRQYLPVLIDDTYYIQQYKNIDSHLNQLITQTSDIERKLSDLRNTNGSAYYIIQQLQQQINENNDKKQSLVNSLDRIQNQSIAMFTLDPVTKKNLDDATAALSSRYMMGVPPKNAYNYPIQGIFADYEYKNIEIMFDPDKTINNHNGDRSAEIISDIKKITGDIPLKISYEKIVPIGGKENNSNVDKNVVESPLKQIKSGILAKNVTCNQGLELIFKAEDSSPACVNPDTAQKLIERGWATNISQPNQITGVKTYDPFGITALIIYHPQITCLTPPSHSYPGGMPSCPPNNFYLKINSNSTAYLMGYNICDDNSCAKNKDLSLLLPINTPLYPNYQSIGLPVNLQWKNGDTVNIKLEVSLNADNKTASLIDLGNSTIVP
jgi:hypothetical protein